MTIPEQNEHSPERALSECYKELVVRKEICVQDCCRQFLATALNLSQPRENCTLDGNNGDQSATNPAGDEMRVF
eukprot:4532624-Amphidinium_carterae.1